MGSIEGTSAHRACEIPESLTLFLGVKIITVFLEILQPPVNCLVPQLVLPLITPLMSLQSPSNTMLRCQISNCFNVLIFPMVPGSWQTWSPPVRIRTHSRNSMPIHDKSRPHK